jgi:hypothetical protein
MHTFTTVVHINGGQKDIKILHFTQIIKIPATVCCDELHVHYFYGCHYLVPIQGESLKNNIHKSKQNLKQNCQVTQKGKKRGKRKTIKY